MKRFGTKLRLSAMMVFMLVICSQLVADTENTFFKTKVGNIEVIALFDASIEMNAGLIKNGDPEVLKKYMPGGTLVCSINAYVIKTGEHTILIDAGCGKNTFRQGYMIENMRKAGIEPENIDAVLITHAHFDHVGGLVNEGKAVFRKAKLFYSKAEGATFDDKALAALPADIKGYYEPANRMMKAYKGRIESFDPGKTIFDGIKSVNISGHTPGHTGYLIESNGERLFIFGDLLHIAQVQFSYPDFSLVYDSDIVKSASIRKSILGWLSDEKIPAAGIHIQFPGIGYVEKKSEGFTFTPINK
jgi:glyoxylase-like metal-dependent hydrolase (beta-lactamase superfamily II)